ncbi:beta-ketoacyl-ACP synthase II [Dorea formicigenerans]|uniref:beta-ketoacyl-ACP synthase II n=1 Tax=Dorea formicigenerans TaxID=39486 RepID=UPI0036F1F579
MANNKVLKRRVVVTGLGAITPIGNSVAEFWDGIRKGQVGIGEITKFDTTDYKVKLAAEVKDFVPGDHMDKKAARRMEAFSQYAVAAAREAYEDSGLEIEKEDPFRAGVMIGSGIGSLQVAEQSYEKILTKGPARVNPLMVPLMISNMAAGNVSIQLGFRGKCSNVVTACATGTNCIGDAFRTIQYGDADMMLAGGTEGCVCPLGIAGFTALTALSASTDPLRASIPFDKDRDGFVLGEGAGVVMLEELEHAKARGAKIYAEVTGYGCTGDAYHITSPAEDGSGAAKAMELAMEEAQITPAQVDYINAHGTSTHHNDLFETRAIKKAFGEAAKDVVINSTKSMIGHLLGAAGGVEFITCVKSMEDGFIHQTVGTKEADEECDLNYAIGSPVEKEIKAAMSNSLGFGGHNATILIQKYEA